MHIALDLKVRFRLVLDVNLWIFLDLDRIGDVDELTRKYPLLPDELALPRIQEPHGISDQQCLHRVIRDQMTSQALGEFGLRFEWSFQPCARMNSHHDILKDRTPAGTHEEATGEAPGLRTTTADDRACIGHTVAQQGAREHVSSSQVSRLPRLEKEVKCADTRGLGMKAPGEGAEPQWLGEQRICGSACEALSLLDRHIPAQIPTGGVGRGEGGRPQPADELGPGVRVGLGAQTEELGEENEMEAIGNDLPRASTDLDDLSPLKSSITQ